MIGHGTRLASWVGLALLLAGAVAAVAQSETACGGEPHTALDFWVGEWRVVDAEGRTVGTNRIEKLQNGCVLEEHWTSADGSTGQSMNYFDPADGVWKQDWVDEGGGVVHYQGGVEDGALRYLGRHIQRDGTVTTARVVLTPLEDGRLHHLIEHSEDGGANWTTYFEARYEPIGGQAVMARAGSPAVSEPARATPQEIEVAPESPAEKPETRSVAEVPSTATRVPGAAVPRQEATQPPAVSQTQPGGRSVAALSRELQREEIPLSQIPELRMASPMVLEVTPGDVARYPENAAWRSIETAPYVCNEVALKQVGVGHRKKGRSLLLIVEAKLFTNRRQKKVDLLVEVLHRGQVVASEEMKNVRLGRSIPAHGVEGLMTTTSFKIAQEMFDEMFAGESRPQVRFTLTVP